MFKLLLACLLAAACALPAAAERFRFLYAKGEQYRILSTVKEDVYVNDRYSHSAEILNRIGIRIADAKDGSGYMECEFQTSEEARGGQVVFSWGQSYDSRFWRDASGFYSIEPRYLMPIVRDVPLLPDRDLKPGDTWTGRGEEVHDLRTSFQMSEPLRFPIDVSYRYEGKASKDGAEYDLIGVNYSVFHRPAYRTRAAQARPAQIAGYSRQTLYWDSARGRPYFYEEEFTFVFTLSSRDTVEYRGTASARIVESSLMDKRKLAEDIRRDIQDLGVPDATVKPDDKGVTLTLDNVRFPPDSAELIPEERAKLDKIGAILSKYPERDLIVTGHTARAGWSEGRQKLSEERAYAVGAYLLGKGVRTKERMIFRGLGDSQPVADNSSEEGREKNRRVEITILEN